MSGRLAIPHPPDEALRDERLFACLQDVAEHPFSLALERDERLGLSRYNGVQVRRRLIELGCVRPHRVSTGRRSGQAVLLELTPVGREHLEAAGVRIDQPEGPLAYRRRYYANRLAGYARRTWPDAAVEIGHGLDSPDHSPDVAVMVPGGGDAEGARSVAFEVIETGDAGGLHSHLRDVDAFDEVFLCADTAEAAADLKEEAQRLVRSEFIQRITCTPVSSLLSAPAESGVQMIGTSTAMAIRATSRRSRPDAALLQHVLEAYGHLHDLDWLQDSPLTGLEAVRERTNPLAPMPEAQALRGLLVDAAQRAAAHARDIPLQAPLHLFLTRYVEGKRVTEIAGELGVSREWCSRAYRKQALKLTGMQFLRLAVPGSRNGSR